MSDLARRYDLRTLPPAPQSVMDPEEARLFGTALEDWEVWSTPSPAPAPTRHIALPDEQRANSCAASGFLFIASMATALLLCLVGFLWNIATAARTEALR